MDRPRLARLDLAEDPDPWAALGFAVTGGAARIGATELRLRGGGGGITGWALHGLETTDLDGLPTAERPARDDQPPAHPNGVIAIDHVVVATPDLPRTVAAFEAAGLPCRRTREAGRGLRQAFFLLRECLVEVAGPAEADGDGPATFWGLTLVVRDLDATAAQLGDRLGPPKDAVQPGRRIATVRREAAGVALPLAFMTART